MSTQCISTEPCSGLRCPKPTVNERSRFCATHRIQSRALYLSIKAGVTLQDCEQIEQVIHASCGKPGLRERTALKVFRRLRQTVVEREAFVERFVHPSCRDEGHARCIEMLRALLARFPATLATKAESSSSTDKDDDDLTSVESRFALLAEGGDDDGAGNDDQHTPADDELETWMEAYALVRPRKPVAVQPEVDLDAAIQSSLAEATSTQQVKDDLRTRLLAALDEESHMEKGHAFCDMLLDTRVFASIYMLYRSNSVQGILPIDHMRDVRIGLRILDAVLHEVVKLAAHTDPKNPSKRLLLDSDLYTLYVYGLKGRRSLLEVVLDHPDWTLNALDALEMYVNDYLGSNPPLGRDGGLDRYHLDVEQALADTAKYVELYPGVPLRNGLHPRRLDLPLDRPSKRPVFLAKWIDVKDADEKKKMKGTTMIAKKRAMNKMVSEKMRLARVTGKPLDQFIPTVSIEQLMPALEAGLITAENPGPLMDIIAAAQREQE